MSRPARPVEVLDREEIDFEVGGANFRAIIQVEQIAGKENRLVTWAIRPLSNGVELPVADAGPIDYTTSKIDQELVDDACERSRSAAEEYLPDDDVRLDVDERIIRGEVVPNE